ncbi:hypothetical protein QQ045_018183 [Rhodiola kirilowii]
MGNTLRCCLACVLPCGALDLIRIVHLNGFVEEISRPITAGEVLRANPNHILSKPTSQGGVVRRILILSPETELKRGGIYFLIPESSLPENKRRKLRSRQSNKKKKIVCSSISNSSQSQPDIDVVDTTSIPDMAVGNSYRKEHQRKKSVEVWRPHLDSIFED